jgi:hypothetical protein
MQCAKQTAACLINQIVLNDGALECTETLRTKISINFSKLYALYSSPNIIRVIKSRRLRWAGYVARMGERRGANRALVGKPEGRRPLGRPRRKWEDNIKMDLREVGWGRRLDQSGSG